MGGSGMGMQGGMGMPQQGMAGAQAGAQMGAMLGGMGSMMGSMMGAMGGAIAQASAQSHVQGLHHGSKVHFENVHTRRNLRIMNNGQIDALGGNGRPATWTVHAHGSHFKFKNGIGHFLAIKGDSVCKGGGGRFCELSVQPHNGNYVIRSTDNRSGVAFPDAGNYPKAATHTGHGQPAQFRINRA